MGKTAEIERLQGNLIRFGTVAEVDHAVARCRVRTGGIVSDWIPWFVPRAGDTVEWSPPAPGEQVILLSPGGDLHDAVALRGLYSDAAPPPASSASRHLVRFRDGAQLEYDDASHALIATLPADGTAEVTAPGGMTVNGDVQINGNLDLTGTATAEVDVVAAGISLKSHKHTGVTSGGAVSGPPR